MLVEDSVPILYGTFAPISEKDKEERERSYPFANAFFHGSCWEGAETHAKIQFCSACREAWLNTPEGISITNYFSEVGPTLEQDIERLRAQQINNARGARNLKLLRIIFYSIPSAFVCSLLSYYITKGFVSGIAIGVFLGVLIGLITNHQIAKTKN